MWSHRRIAVVVPAYREERLIGRTLAGIPRWVDNIHVVDDASPDRTLESIRAIRDPRIAVHAHGTNRGVGAAIATGYRAALATGADVVAVMAADDQMDPKDLAAVVRPVAERVADYVKGNRFRHAEWRKMPLARRMGSRALAGLTRGATGLNVGDTQCGYTAISRAALQALPFEELWPRYGYPNDLLGMLAARQLRVCEVPVRPVYADEASGLRAWHLLSIAWVIARRWHTERTRPTAIAREA